MSCLIEPPSGFCDSEISSRAAQKSARWLSDWASAASVTMPRSMAASSSAIMAPGTGSASSASTYHGEGADSGWRTPAWRIVNCRAMSAMSSKATTRLPLISFASDRRSTAACGEGTAMKAVSWLFGLGKSFITAAVMMPSVPSAPMKRSRRS